MFYNPLQSKQHILEKVAVLGMNELGWRLKLWIIQIFVNLLKYYLFVCICFQREKYRGERSTERLIQFVLERSPVSAFKLTLDNFADLKVHHVKPWLVTICGLKTGKCYFSYERERGRDMLVLIYCTHTNNW